ncbi:MAG TPA: hypothetical protein VFJ05_06655 [Nitrososphaeraceae archaeon]|nr:hypothetical protein [Nitrososphaeraceae archaeon]
MNETYWVKPFAIFGDPKLVIGLAPPANGGNRTGRIFTGDSSGDWLVKALKQGLQINLQGYQRMMDRY